MKTSLAALTVGAALAAACPAAAAAAYWTGFYAGAELGQQRSQTDWRTTAFGSPASQAALDPGTAAQRFKTSDLHLGGLAGYDYQINSYLVLGLEARFAADFGSHTESGIPGFGFYTPGVPHEDAIKAKTKWDGSVGLRAGVPLLENTLVFVTGGLALAEQEFTLSCGTGPEGGCEPADPYTNERFSDLRLGWTIGAGVESRLSAHWAARFDYRYADYGSSHHTFIAGYPADDFTAKLATTSQLFSLALVYRF